MHLRRLVPTLLGLAALAVTSLPALAGPPESPAEAQAGPLAYTIIETDGCALGTVDLTTGAITEIGPFTVAACVHDLAFAPDGALFGTLEIKKVLSVQLVQFDVATGVPTVLGPLTGSFTESTQYGEELGIAFGPDNQMYVGMGTDEADCFTGAFACLYRVDPATRVATLVGPPSAVDGPFADKPLIQMTAGCSGPLRTTVYRVENEEATQYLTTLATTNGAATQGALLDLGADVVGLELDKATGLLYALTRAGESPPAISLVDPATGESTKTTDVGEVEGGIRSLAIPGSCTTPPPPVIQPTFTG